MFESYYPPLIILITKELIINKGNLKKDELLNMFIKVYKRAESKNNLNIK
jgi:hypothetical protein